MENKNEEIKEEANINIVEEKKKEDNINKEDKNEKSNLNKEEKKSNKEDKKEEKDLNIKKNTKCINNILINKENENKNEKSENQNLNKDINNKQNVNKEKNKTIIEEKKEQQDSNIVLKSINKEDKKEDNNINKKDKKEENSIYKEENNKEANNEEIKINKEENNINIKDKNEEKNIKVDIKENQKVIKQENNIEEKNGKKGEIIPKNNDCIMNKDEKGNIKNENKIFENENKEKNLENKIEKKEPGEITTSEINKKILEKLDKDKLRSIAKNSPERIKSNIEDLITYLKNSTIGLDDFEKAYIIFYWIHENIEYDIKNKKNKDLDVTPIFVYKAGKTICEGYSRFYEYIGKQIELNIIYVKGRTKSNQSSDIFETHAWNILQVNENKYLIDTTWGSGSVENEINYNKILKEFYFCCDPEYFIFSHFPSDPNYQLLNNPIGNDEFSKTVFFSHLFFKYFKGSPQLYYLIKTKKECTIKLYKKIPKCGIKVEILTRRGNQYSSAYNSGCRNNIIYKENFIDIRLIFTKKNEYLIYIFVENLDNLDKVEKKNSKDLNKPFPLTFFPFGGFGINFSKPVSYTKILEYKVIITDNVENNKNGFKAEKKSGPKALDHDEIISKLNKEKIKLIIDKSPKIEKSKLKDFIDYLNNETKNFSEFEKAYSLYYWIYKNISYGSNGNKINETDYKKIYKSKKLNFLCSKMYTYILKKIGLNIFDIKGYSKNTGSYFQDDIIMEFHYSWNILKVKENYYIINPSIYYFIDEKELNDFYFCAKPEEFIWANLPKEPKWQLLENPITTEEFQKRIKLNHSFFKYLKSADKIYHTYTIENENKFSLKFYKKKENSKIYGKLLGEEGNFEKQNYFIENLGCKCKNNDEKDFTDVICYFEEKKEYMLYIYANDGSSKTYTKVAEFFFKYSK